MVEEDSLRDPHHDTVSTRGRCLTQHISLKKYLILIANKNKQTRNALYASHASQRIAFALLTLYKRSHLNDHKLYRLQT
jgi:hypothetical protein